MSTRKRLPSPRISAVLPTFNERENIGRLIDEILALLGREGVEVVVVDDDSPDGTWRIVEEKARRDKRIRLLRRIGKKGLTSALNDGIRAAKGEIVVWMDCDFQMPPAKIPELVGAIERGYDVAVGSRFVKGGGDLRNDRTLRQRRIIYIHRFLSRLICAVSAAVLRLNFRDWTSGFIAIRRDIFDHVSLRGDYGEYFMYLIHDAIRSGYRVIEIPYVVTPRLAGVGKTSSSYWGMFKKGVKYLNALFALVLFHRYKK